MPKTLAAGIAAAALLLAATACAPKEEATNSSSAGAAGSCDKADLALTTEGRLTVGTDSPAYDPWFSGDDPTNGKGYESAVAYAVAKQLGFSKSEVKWEVVPFNSSYAPGDKSFDFDINLISITPAREKAVSFSRGYYTAAQAVIALDDAKAKGATSVAALKDLKLGAQTGTTSLTVIRDEIQPTSDPLVFDDTNAAKQALVNGQVDAIVADLPTAFYITAAEIEGSTIVGQFESSSDPEQFGLLSQKGSELTACLDQALDALDQDGTLAALEKEWLSEKVDVPSLSKG